eukprot:gene8831-9737_t
MSKSPFQESILIGAKAKIAKGSNERGEPPKASFTSCQDRYPQCNDYASWGECTKNPGWMIVNCPFSCKSCHLRDPKIRCDRSFLNISSQPIFEPGDMDRMFSTLIDRVGHKYPITMHSSSPWVFTFENFTTEDEGIAILNSVQDHWERSTDSGSENEFGEAGRILSSGRTSSNAWCRQNCMDDPHVQNVMKKIEEVTLVPTGHSESLQILRYEKGQFYNTHNDMGPGQNHLACGPRILTFFLYLSDVEEGGETNFPNIGIKVQPKRGRAVLWPSTMNDNLLKMDPRTNHQAMPVIKGIKLAANAWIHLYDFQQSNLWGCTGAFDYLD